MMPALETETAQKSSSAGVAVKRTWRGRPFGHGRHGGRRIPGPVAVPQEARGRECRHEQDDADGDARLAAGAEPAAAAPAAAAAAVTQGSVSAS